jgi:DNA repair protein RecO (recombination protein O)
MLHSERAFVLRTVRFGEADLIVRLLNSSGTKITCLARSALKSRKRFGGGVLEPMNYVQISYQRRGLDAVDEKLATLREASLVNGFDGLRARLDRLEAGLQWARLIDQVAQAGEAHASDLFNLFGNGLRALEKAETVASLHVTFLCKLLASQGVLDRSEEWATLLSHPIADSERHSVDESRLRQWSAELERQANRYISGLSAPG